MPFINTEYKETVNSLTDSLKNRLNNRYYLFNDKKAFIVTYFNRNNNQSTMDETLRIEQAAYGPDSPVRYNKINSACIYSNDLRIEVNMEFNDIGYESSTIEGEFIVLPNTIIPYQDDHFCINHADKDYLFKVTNVSIDTLEDGANFYKCTYQYFKGDSEAINKQVVANYEMVMNNIGTNLKPIIRSEDYNMVDRIDHMLLRLKSYYRAIFMKDRVQTFVCNHDGYNIYDSFLIEFLIRNNILNKIGGDYTFVDHQILVPKTFPIDYDHTLFRAIEKKSLDNMIRTASAHSIDDINCLFDSRPEPYYKVIYNDISIYHKQLDIIDLTLIDNINNNTLYDDKEHCILNTVIKYMNNEDILLTDIEFLENLDYCESLMLFYYIPIVMYILENEAQSLFK